MRLAQTDELPWRRGLEHRGGIFHFRNVLEGTPGRLDNFQLSLGRMGGEFYSPRHRHNFEQIRIQIAGALDYARDGKMTAGMIGYYPEGVFYGPQSQAPDDEPQTLVLQFGGASGAGYLCREEVKAGMDALAAQGEFRNGVFRRHGDTEGRRNTDGYQAIWEHIRARPMDYPAPRYSRPLLIDPAAFAWTDRPEPGCAEKFLGGFTERGASVRCLRLEPGARLRLAGRSVLVILDGAGEIAGGAYRRLTALFLDHDETADILAESATEAIALGLPDLRPLMAREFADAAA
jgi:hypothetical protein